MSLTMTVEADRLIGMNKSLSTAGLYILYTE